MKRLIAIAAAIAAMTAAAPAWAAKVFVLDNVTLQGGGTLTGSFTTDDALSSLLSVNITASSGTFGPGVFSTFTYDNAALADWVSLPTQGFRISTNGYAKQLRLDFFCLAVKKPLRQVDLVTGFYHQHGIALAKRSAAHQPSSPRLEQVSILFCGLRRQRPQA